MQQLVRFVLQRRIFNLFAFLACVGLICAALVFQAQGEEPCPLCLIQRYCVVAVGIVYLIAAIAHPKKLWISRIFAVLLLVTASAGGFSSGRHVWIQSLSEDEVPACTGSLEYMTESFGWAETLRVVLLDGSGDCHDSSWKFLYLTMPMWVLIWFIGLGIFGFLRNWIPDESSKYQAFNP